MSRILYFLAEYFTFYVHLNWWLQYELLKNTKLSLKQSLAKSAVFAKILFYPSKQTLTQIDIRIAQSNPSLVPALAAEIDKGGSA